MALTDTQLTQIATVRAQCKNICANLTSPVVQATFPGRGSWEDAKIRIEVDYGQLEGVRVWVKLAPDVLVFDTDLAANRKYMDGAWRTYVGTKNTAATTAKAAADAAAVTADAANYAAVDDATLFP